MKHVKQTFLSLLIMSSSAYAYDGSGARCWSHQTPAGNGNFADVNLLLHYVEGAANQIDLLGSVNLIQAYGEAIDNPENMVVSWIVTAENLVADSKYKP